MALDQNHRAQVNEAGDLVIPAATAQKFGFAPGSELRFEEKEDGIHLRRPVSHLAKVYIEPTSRCNLSCRTCIRNAWDEPMGRMTLTVFNRIIRDIQRLPARPSIFFGGFGEPLSHPKIVEMVAHASLVSHKVELITNGMLLTKERSLALIQVGLSTLWVSVDGATPESYADIRLGAELPNIFRNIAQYRDLYRQTLGGEPRIGIAFVAMKRNIADLPDLLQMSARLGVSHYMVTNVLPYTREMCAERLYTRSVDAFVSQPSPWSPRLDFPLMDVNQDTRDALIQMLSIHRRNFLMNPDQGDEHNRCPFIHTGSTAIAWNGDLSPCLPLMHAHVSFLQNKQRAVKRHSLGNVSQKSLLELWNAPEYVDFRKRVDEFDFSPCSVCASCELSDANQEDCFGNVFPTCGGCLWAQGFIRCP